MDSTRPAGTARLLRVEDAARQLSIGRTKTYELIATGMLRAVHIGRATRVSDNEISRFIRSLELDAPPPVAAGVTPPPVALWTDKNTLAD